MSPADTIVALSSGVAPALRVIVRMSGPDAWNAARRLGLSSDRPGAFHVDLSFADLTCPAWVYLFRTPRSYTGEDLVEFHLPGSPVLAKMLLADLTAQGARPADAGEFTARAYFNGRLDLTEAEGVAATIHAQNAAELHVARQLLSGELSRRLRPITDLLTETLALIEVAIDFSEEDVSFLSADQVRSRVRDADAQLADLITGSVRFERIAHEPRIVLVGRPNAGKSTLLNALAQTDRAVVSDIAGTTRDAIWATVALPRGLVRVIDVAGLEVSAENEIDRQMQARARQMIEEAELVVLLRSVIDVEPNPAVTREADLIVWTKSDLRAKPQATPRDGDDGMLSISAKTGEHLNDLKQRLDTLAFGPASNSASPQLALNMRHLDAIARTRSVLARVLQLPENIGPEFLAAELREALDELGQILGVISPDDVLGKIFSTFCIGK